MAYNPSACRALFNTGTLTTITGIIAETSIVSFNMKGGTMGPNSSLAIWALIETNNDASVKIFTIKFGAATVFTSTLTSLTMVHRPTMIWNRNALNSQIANPGSGTTYQNGVGTTTLALNTFAIDTSADVLIDFRGQLDGAGDTMSVLAITINLNP